MRHSPQIDQKHSEAIRAEVAERLEIILRLGNPEKVPRRIRRLMDRLAEQDREFEMGRSPSIVPSENEGWLRRLLAGRGR